MRQRQLFKLDLNYWIRDRSLVEFCHWRLSATGWYSSDSLMQVKPSVSSFIDIPQSVGLAAYPFHSFFLLHACDPSFFSFLVLSFCLFFLSFPTLFPFFIGSFFRSYFFFLILIHASIPSFLLLSNYMYIFFVTYLWISTFNTRRRKNRGLLGFWRVCRWREIGGTKRCLELREITIKPKTLCGARIANFQDNKHPRGRRFKSL